MKVTDARRLKAKSDFVLNAPRLNLTADFLGQQFSLKNRQYTVIGLNHRLRKYQVIVEDTEHRFRTFKLEDVQAMIKAATPRSTAAE